MDFNISVTDMGARNEVEDVSVFWEGNAICSSYCFLMFVEDNYDPSGFWCGAKHGYFNFF